MHVVLTDMEVFAKHLDEFIVIIADINDNIVNGIVSLLRHVKYNEISQINLFLSYVTFLYP